MSTSNPSVVPIRMSYRFGSLVAFKKTGKHHGSEKEKEQNLTLICIYYNDILELQKRANYVSIKVFPRLCVGKSHFQSLNSQFDSHLLLKSPQQRLPALALLLLPYACPDAVACVLRPASSSMLPYCSI